MTGLDRPADPKGTTRCASCETETDGRDLCENCDDRAPLPCDGA